MVYFVKIFSLFKREGGDFVASCKIIWVLEFDDIYHVLFYAYPVDKAFKVWQRCCF